MKIIRTFLSSIGCFLALLFLIQIASTGAENAGLISCADQCEHEATNQSASNSEPFHCSLHCFCHTVTVNTDPFIRLLPSMVVQTPSFSILNETAPEGPVFGIDYPPQRA